MADKPLGNLFVRVVADVANFVRGMTTVERVSNKTRTSLASFARGGISAFAGLFAGTQLTRFIGELSDMGVAVEEANIKFQRTFEDSAASIEGFAQTFSRSTGITRAAGLDMVATVGAIAQGMGIAQDQSARFGRDILSVAADLTAFNNVPITRSLNAMRSALTGNFVALKSLGIVLSKSVVTQRAMAATGIENADALTESQIAAAALLEVVDRMGPAFGAMAEEATSTAGKIRTLQGAFLATKESVGALIAPVTGFFAGVLQRGLDGVTKSTARFRFTLGSLVESLREVSGRATPETAANLVELRAEYEAVAASVNNATAAHADFAKVADEILAPVLTVQRGQLENVTIAFRELGQPIALVLPKLEGLTNAMIANEVATAGAALANRDFASTLGGIGGFIGRATGILGTVGLALGPVGLVGGLLSSFAGFFAHGGNIPAGQTGVVGESGPELVSGPATVSPMGGGDIVINIVTESGRALVDSIRVKNERDQDVRRVIRIPVSAIATG